MKYARIINGYVEEIFVPMQGHTIEESFTSEVVNMFEQCPEEVLAGWTKNQDGTFSAPVIETEIKNT
jgi:hypothetical protein